MSDKLLGGKMMDAIQYGGKTYIHEPDVRHAINAALATNGERNARIEALERENAALRETLTEKSEAWRLLYVEVLAAKVALGDEPGAYSDEPLFKRINALRIEGHSQGRGK